MLITGFLKSALSDPDAPCLHKYLNDIWLSYSRSEVVDAATRLCAQWQRDGVSQGERVIVLMDNRPEWAVVAIASAMYGLVIVPAYTTHRVPEIEYLIRQSEAGLAVVLAGELLDRFLETELNQQLKVYSAEEHDRGLFSQYVDASYQSQESADPSVPYALIATSGTNGNPKLVSLSQNNLLANVTSILQVLREADLLQPHRFLSFLPLAHAYEHMAGLYLPLHLGGEIFYCDKLDKLSPMMAEVQPTLMTAVPRLYELLYSRITAQIAKESRIKQFLFKTTIRLGNQEKLSIKDAVLNRVCERLVRGKVRQRFGGKLQYFVSGGAALNPEISSFFQGLGIGILQGYGQTEASPVISVNRPGSERVDSVGPPLPGVEVCLADDGELLVRGDNVMLGYWNDTEATSETIRNGWLHTGDLAAIDPDGHIRIVGRLKDLIVNSGGDNIAPAPIEQELSLYPEVEQVVVVGDGRPWLSAIISLSADIDPSQGDEILYSILKRYNADKSPLVQVRKAVLMKEPCSIDNGLLTPTQKVKRAQVIQMYKESIDHLYRRSSS